VPFAISSNEFASIGSDANTQIGKLEMINSIAKIIESILLNFILFSPSIFKNSDSKLFSVISVADLKIDLYINFNIA